MRHARLVHWRLSRPCAQSVCCRRCVNWEGGGVYLRHCVLGPAPSLFVIFAWAMCCLCVFLLHRWLVSCKRAAWYALFALTRHPLFVLCTLGLLHV
ncbi:hypothetical protein COO60DRAFT_428586 [Scenedesmus sp. NREL 46B-D3]|nr:hypothetical protein COO60DRAFT_428586 [Scenedesmus sp. NREL 46B-D3]